ncbi:hypothetical protein ACFQ7J_21770 [Streptomyces sp. NPDC056501]|uniref:hypothetical protein n=1 Tax=Streptomyces sp. NPDC056501 TaxID=3345841 RepID=UPI00368B4B24
MEALSTGYQRLLLGYAAANLDAAMWIDTHSEEGRLRLATALDYLYKAVQLERGDVRRGAAGLGESGVLAPSGIDESAARRSGPPNG